MPDSLVHDAFLYKAYNKDGQMLCWAGRPVERLDNGEYVVRTGSCRLIATRLERLAAGDVVMTNHGLVKIEKVNQKSVWVRPNCDESLPQEKILV